MRQPLKPLFARSAKRLLQMAMILLICGTAIVSTEINAQVRSGVAFLKILPGVRNQGFAGSYSGVIDEMHSLVSNPGATGFLREWQWSTSYTEWIADSYSLSWMYGRQIATPFSQKSKFALGIHYQGVREFNSTGDPTQAMASASDALFTLSFGNPLSAISPNLAFGANLKYYRSDLDGVVAGSWMTDLGLLFKTNRFKTQIMNFDYGYFSAGFSVNQLGQPINFIAVDTPLPRTFRGGVALNMGSHDGFQLQLNTDYNKYRDEVSHVSVGAELTWKYLLGVRGGYNFNDNLLSKLTFGLSYRIGNVPPLAGKGKALRLDFAYLEGNDFFSPPLRGGINQYPVSPEKFDIESTDRTEYEVTDPIGLAWSESVDPDLYDDVRYLLFMSQNDESALAQFVKNAREDADLTLPFLIDSTRNSGNFLVWDVPGIRSKTGNISFTLQPTPEHQPGEYFWTVLAYDRDQNIRFVESIRNFRINAPVIPPPPDPAYDLMISQQIAFTPLRPKVLFEFNKFALTETSKKQLDILGEAFDSPALSNVFIKLGGHTDQRGSQKYNQKLSFGRVNSVAEYLESNHSISESRIFAYGYGKKFPLRDANLLNEKAEKDAAHTLNRRVDIYLLKSANRDTTNQPIDNVSLVRAVFQGEPVYYTLTVRNAGADTAKSVTVSGEIPELAEFVPGSFSTTIAPASDEMSAMELRWQFAAIAPGETLEIKYALVVNRQPPSNPYQLVHAVTVQSTFDIESENNRSMESIFVIPILRD